MANAGENVESGDSFKEELGGLVAEFERASEALPPDEHTLRQWTPRARGLYSRVDASGETGRNNLLQKIKGFGCACGSCARIAGGIVSNAKNKGTMVNLDTHVKGSNDRDRRTVFRLYFGWHDESQRVIVG